MATIGREKSPAVAEWFAATKHGDQKYGNQPYTYHLEEAVTQLQAHVLTLPALKFYDQDILVSATWLHDVVEDTGTLPSQLEGLFCPAIVELVLAVTDGPGKNRKERKSKTYEQIRAVGPAALAVKLADRLANALVCGLSKDSNSMLEMYRKEQAQFQLELEMPGFEPAFQKIRDYLAMSPLD